MKFSMFCKLLTIAALLTITAGMASAGNVDVFCGGFSIAGTGVAGYFVTPISNPVTTGTVSCPAFTAAMLPAGDTFVNEQIVLQADYTGGNTGTNTTATTFSAGTLAIPTDILTVTGTVTSGSYSDNFGANYPYDGTMGGASFWYDGTYKQTVLPTTSGTVAYSASITVGNVQAVSGNVWEVINYTSSAPEPATMALLGSALVGLGLIGRKRFSR